ncbi:MAG: 30S ribosomal protein S12 methylthiotransferase RimO [Treponemataceae bacterium]|nr:MAG: 30S ribosomal protein S12 methylthiotransferase RimO [Treponemataceae bacterium]
MKESVTKKPTIEFFFDQHGCAKNQVDGEQMIAVLLDKTAAQDAHGLAHTFTQVFDPSHADVIIINTCGFIESAKKESLDALITLRKNCPKAKIIFAGCLAERYAEVFLAELPEADGIFGLADKTQLADYALKLLSGETLGDIPQQKNPATEITKTAEISEIAKIAEIAEIEEIDRTQLLAGKKSVYVKITEGCSNHCTFCAIPLIRGEGRSRPVAAIMREIKMFLENGVFEINLVGQDIASHNALSELLEKISALPGGFWLRLLYIHPDHFPFSILPLMARDKRLLPYFDIPFQSGSDAIIRAMGRRGSRSAYIELIEKIRAELPDAVCRTTFLAGFPGETEDDAQKSADFLRTIQSDWSGVFCYSKEDGTVAAKMKNHVKKNIAKNRAQVLMNIQDEIIAQKLAHCVGRTYDVLIEEVFEASDTATDVENAQDEKSESCYALCRAWFQAPEVDGTIVLVFDADSPCAKKICEGAVVKAHITAARPPCLEARLAEGVY